MNHRTLWISTFAALFVCLTAPPIAGQSVDYTFTGGSAAGNAGATVLIPFTFDNEGADVLGWSYGVCSDPAEVSPVAIDPAHPFPYISNLSLNLAVLVRDPGDGSRRFARVKIPPVLPRFVPLGDGERFVPLAVPGASFFSIAGVNGDGVFWGGTTEGAYVARPVFASVPEPSTALLLATAIAGLAARRRHCHR